LREKPEKYIVIVSETISYKAQKSEAVAYLSVMPQIQIRTRASLE